jgi:hypothetical protein
VVIVGNSLVPSADDALGLDPFDRRHPELEANVEGVTGVSEYSMEQAQQLERLSPIKFCTLPEFFLYEATNEYIPRDYLEEGQSYDVRKTRAQSSFEPFYSHLRNLTIGTALRKGVVVPETVDAAWGTFFEDCDLEGHSLTSFTKELFTAAVDAGVAGIWVEYPKLPTNLSAEEERALNPRPYLVLIKCDQVLECRHDIFSAQVLGQSLFGSFPTYLRIKGEIRRQSATNEFFEEVLPAVFVYDTVEGVFEPTSELNDTLRPLPSGRRVRCRTFVKQNVPGNTDKYIQEGEERYLSIPFIPFVPVLGGEKEAFFRARPLLLDIARLNLHHWAISADLAESIHLTASPILTMTGVRPDDEVKAGSGRTLSSQNPDARFNMMSASMDGAEVTLKNLDRIEKSMERLAAVAMTTGKTQAESGFAKLLDRSQSDSQLAVLVQSLEDALNRALMYAAAYREYAPVKITISKNFIPVKLHSQQVMAYSSLFKDGVITIELFMRMLESGELFEGIPDFSVADILKKMNLTGGETVRELGPGAGSGPVDGRSSRARVEVDNTNPLSEGADREVSEPGFEPSEA